MPTASALFRNPFRAPIRFLGRGFAALLAVASAEAAYVGDWVSYSDFSVPTCMVAWHGELFVGTNGGVRRVQSSSPFAQTHYNNIQGLLDVRIVGLAVDADDRLWAAGQSGQLFRFEGGNWSAWGKAYRAAGWTINPRTLAASGKYLIIGSKQGLSLFDRTTGLAAVNLTKFGTLGQQPVTGLLPLGDTLFIATGKHVLKAAIDWKNALSTRFGGTIYDPAIWKPAEGLAPLPDFVSERAIGDTATRSPEEDTARALEDARPVELSLDGGRVFAHDTGTVLLSPFPVKALTTRDAVVDGLTVTFAPRMETAVGIGDRLWIGGQQGLLRFDRMSGFVAHQAGSRLPEHSVNGPNRKVAAVAAKPGGALVMTADGVYDLANAARGKIFELPNLREVYTNQLRSIAHLKDGGVLLGGWGFGLVRIGSDGKTQTWNGTNSCLKDVLPNFTVIHTMSDPRGNDVWMTQLENVAGREVYVMAHLDLSTGKVSCPDVEGDAYHQFATRILNDDVFAVAAPKGIRLYRFGIGGVVQKAGSVKGGSGDDFGRDMALDGHNRLWALMNGKLGYVDSLSMKLGPDKTPEVTYLDGFPGKNCGVMESDARQGIWIGCENGMYHLKPAAQAAQSELDHFDTEDGLLGDLVLDMSIDPLTGMLWVVSENGVSSYQSDAKPFISGAGDVKAYPNPFRAKHSLLVIDNVPKGATAAIFTQSGDAVRRFASGEARGNQFQWDGTNHAGKRVKPGVYFYSVSAASGSNRGKIIVAR